MKKFIIIMILLLSVVVFFGCSADKESEDDKAIKSLVDEQFRCFEEKDWEGYVKTIDLPDEEFEANVEAATAMFSQFDLEITVEKMEIVKVEGDKAEVRIVQVTKNKNDANFRDNKLTALHKLVKKDGKWFFSESEIENTEYLD